MSIHMDSYFNRLFITIYPTYTQNLQKNKTISKYLSITRVILISIFRFYRSSWFGFVFVGFQHVIIYVVWENDINNQ